MTMEILILTLLDDNPGSAYTVSDNAYSLAFYYSRYHSKINF